MRTSFAVLLLMASLTVTAAEQSSQTAEKKSLVSRFLSKGEARMALTEGDERRYFDLLHLGEMRAKTGLPLAGLSLAEGREAARKHYANEAVDFTQAERNAIEGMLQRLYPRLMATAPLYARHPWCFIKVGIRIEGGLPHTRGDCIVFSSRYVNDFAELAAQKRFDVLDGPFSNLLVHEQTHVLQRRYPVLFAALYTKILKYRHIVPAPLTPWLQENGMTNPDAMDTGWAYPVSEGGDARWIMPYLVLRNLTQPKMPRDFINIGVPVMEGRNGWEIVNAPNGLNQELVANFMAYARQFPNPDQAYHPNEFAADVLAEWLVPSGGADMEHPIAKNTIAWARVSLR